MIMSIVERQVKTLKSWWFQNLTFVIWVIITTSVWIHGDRSTNIGPEWGISRVKWPLSGCSGGPFSRAHCDDGKLSGESIVSVSPDNLWIIDSRISSIAKTRAVGPKLQNIKLFQIRRQNKRARSAQNGGVKPINATAFENKLQLYNSCWCKFNEGESHTDLLL